MPSLPGVVQRIVSGGQTGVDRAGLDVALARGLACGGWCPRGRRAEDGRIPERFPLDETDSADYAVRTKRNVRDSDATLILTRGPLTGGTALTRQAAWALGRPCLVVDLDAAPDAERVSRWLGDHAVRVLNVAGPRASKAPRDLRTGRRVFERRACAGGTGVGPGGRRARGVRARTRAGAGRRMCCHHVP